MQAHTYYQQALTMGEQKLTFDHPLLVRCRDTMENACLNS